jgi:hypothetical protein
MFDFSTMNILGDNKTLLWVGLGLMVVAIAVYVYMTRKPTSSQQPLSASQPQQQYQQFQQSSMEACQVHPAESFQHPGEQQPTQITCMVTDSGEQVCSDSAMPSQDTPQSISA